MNTKIYKLGDISIIKNGKTPFTKNKFFWKKEIPFFQPSNLETMNTKRFISKNKNWFKRKGTVLISTNATIGKIGILKEKGWFNQQITSIEAKKKFILDKYLFYYFLNNKKVIKSKGIGTIFSSISIKIFKNWKINLINIEEQQKIIDIIEPIEKQIKIINILIEKLTLFIKDFINKSLLDPTNITYKLKEIFEISRGKVINWRYIEKNFGIYPIYSSKTFNNGVFGNINTYDYDGEFLTWTTDGYAGKVFYRNGKFNCTNVCGILKLKNEFKNELNIKFLYFLLKKNIKKHVTIGDTRNRLMSNIVENIELNICSFNKQKKIINFLELKEIFKKINIKLNKCKNNLIKLLI